MKEITGNIIYGLLNDRYDRVACDYVILSPDGGYRGAESHKEAVVCAIEMIGERYGLDFRVETDKMTAAATDAEELLKIPSDAYFAERKRTDRSFTAGGPVPYWYAFLEPPHGTPYTKSDFTVFNAILIPDRDETEIYRWNDGFSDYFDAGREWWGTGLWSIFDRKTGLFTVIGASLTD